MKNMLLTRVKNIKLALNNRGSALLTAVLAVSFLTILATTLLYITAMNFQIKQADYQNKKTFYTGEEALEEIKANLMYDVSEATGLANEDLAMNYIAAGGPDVRLLQYNNAFVTRIQEVWDDRLSGGSWDDLMNAYVADTTNYRIEMDLGYDSNGDNHLDSTECLEIDANNGQVIIRGVKVTYVNPQNHRATVITTDFRVNAPKIDWSAEGALTALPPGVAPEDAGKKELVNPCGSVVYTNWVKE